MGDTYRIRAKAEKEFPLDEYAPETYPMAEVAPRGDTCKTRGYSRQTSMIDEAPVRLMKGTITGFDDNAFEIK